MLNQTTHIHNCKLMGLDSVELLVEVEEYFGISIPDAEAEKAYTVGALIDIVGRQLNVTETKSELHDDILKRVQVVLVQMKLTDDFVGPTDPVSKYIPSYNTELWKAFETELKLDVPAPDLTPVNSTKFIDKIKRAIKWSPMYDWSSITIDHFVAAICAKNLEHLVDRSRIKSTYEIYIAIMAITVDKIGVDYYEITPDKSFTNDLGVD